jgi:hypothetical protein
VHFLSNINVQDKGSRIWRHDRAEELRLAQTKIKGPGLRRS